MAYQNNKLHHRRNHHNHYHHQYGRSPYNEYQVYEYKAKEEPEVRRSFYSPRYDHMGWKSNTKEGDEEVEASSLAETKRALERLRHGEHNSDEDVDQEAEDFIQLEHRRINLTKPML